MKATIMIEDKEDGRVTVELGFDPPLSTDPDAKATPAAILASAAVDAMSDLIKALPTENPANN